MASASSVTFGWINFALGIHKTANQIRVFEIDFIHFGLAKVAFFLFYFCRFVVIAIIHDDLNRESTLIFLEYSLIRDY